MLEFFTIWFVVMLKLFIMQFEQLTTAMMIINAQN